MMASMFALEILGFELELGPARARELTLLGGRCAIA
jgi:hypothetical protein